MLIRISRNVEGRCCYAQAEVFQPQEGGAKGFGCNQASGEHEAGAFAASVPLLVGVLPLLRIQRVGPKKFKS